MYLQIRIQSTRYLQMKGNFGILTTDHVCQNVLFPGPQTYTPNQVYVPICNEAFNFALLLECFQALSLLRYSWSWLEYVCIKHLLLPFSLLLTDESVVNNSTTFQMKPVPSLKPFLACYMPTTLYLKSFLCYQL